MKWVFWCSTNKLTSLDGAPKIVKGYFYCYDNKLTSLKYGPKEVNGFFSCSYNNLTSLEGAPEIVQGSFYCQINPLSQSEVDKLIKVDTKGEIIVPDRLTPPTKNDYRLYKKLGDKKYFKLKELKDKLKWNLKTQNMEI